MPNAMPVVSVIIPVYNARDYIEQCISSILEQTLVELELICIDDGSSDASAAICERIAESDERVVVLRQKNKGASAARNRGIRAARGIWICFVDADDWLEKDMLESLVGIARPETDLVICDHYHNYVNGKQKRIGDFGETQVWDRNRIDIELRKFLCKGIKSYRPYGHIGFPWARIYRKSMIEAESILFPENVVRTEDGIFNMYAFQNSREIIYLYHPLYHYRVLSDSISHKPYPAIVSKTEEDFKEVRAFAARYKMNDAIFLQGIDVRVCTWFYKYLAYYYFLTKTINDLGWKRVKEEIRCLLHKQPYAKAFKEVNLKLMRPGERLFTWMLQHEWIDCTFLLVRGRMWIKSIKTSRQS